MTNIVDLTRRGVTPRLADLPLPEANAPSADMAAFQARERRSFESKFPPIAAGDFLPPMTWSQLERQLEHLAPSSLTRGLVKPLIDQLREETAWRSPEMVLCQLILISGLVLEPPSSMDREDGSPSYGEAPMP